MTLQGNSMYVSHIFMTSQYESTCVFHSGQTQRAYANWTDLMAANYREIQNTCSKRQKIKQFLEREALNVEYL